MLHVLLSARMLAFHALVVLIVPSFIWLGFWQLGRWEDKSAAVALQEANIAADPVPADRLTGPGEEVTADERWRPVTATGRYDTEHELLVRNRDGSSGVGMHVLTPLVTDNGDALLVNRGWIEQPPTATSRPDVPPPPEGSVTVTGRLQNSETEASTGIRQRGGLPERQIMIVDVDRISADLPYPVYGGYAELTEQRPEGRGQPEPVSPPDFDAGMNLSYAVQWWVFTAIAVGGWGFLMRREVADARDGGGGSAGGGDGGDGGGGAPGGAGPGDGGTAESDARNAFAEQRPTAESARQPQAAAAAPAADRSRTVPHRERSERSERSDARL